MKLATSNVRGASSVASVEHALAELSGVASIAVWMPDQQIDVLFDETEIDAALMVAILQEAGCDLPALPGN